MSSSRPQSDATLSVRRPESRDARSGVLFRGGRADARISRLVEPQAVAIGGGVSQAGAVFWEPLSSALAASLRSDHIATPRLLPAELTDDAGLYGAALQLITRA
jgi:predicted NBD/HSP70 family sugar kinase